MATENIRATLELGLDTRKVESGLKTVLNKIGAAQGDVFTTGLTEAKTEVQQLQAKLIELRTSSKVFKQGSEDAKFLSTEISDIARTVSILNLTIEKLENSRFGATAQNIRQLEKVKALIQQTAQRNPLENLPSGASKRSQEEVNPILQRGLKEVQTEASKARAEIELLRAATKKKADVKALDQMEQNLKDVEMAANDAQQGIARIFAKGGTVNPEQVKKDFDGYKERIKGVTEQTGEMAKGTHRNTLASINLLRVVQDAEYGMLGMANNIQEVVLSLSLARAAGISATSMFKGMIKELLIGKLALAFWPTVIIMLIRNWDALTRAMEKAYDETVLFFGAMDRLEYESREVERAFRALKHLDMDVMFQNLTGDAKQFATEGLARVASEMRKLLDVQADLRGNQLKSAGLVNVVGGVVGQQNLIEDRDRILSGLRLKYGLEQEQAELLYDTYVKEEKEYQVQMLTRNSIWQVSGKYMLDANNAAIESGKKLVEQLGKEGHERIELIQTYAREKGALTDEINALRRDRAAASNEYLKADLDRQISLKANELLLYDEKFLESNKDKEKATKKGRDTEMINLRRYLSDLKSIFSDEQKLRELAFARKTRLIDAEINNERQLFEYRQGIIRRTNISLRTDNAERIRLQQQEYQDELRAISQRRQDAQREIDQIDYLEEQRAIITSAYQKQIDTLRDKLSTLTREDMRTEVERDIGEVQRELKEETQQLTTSIEEITARLPYLREVASTSGVAMYALRTQFEALNAAIERNRLREYADELRNIRRETEQMRQGRDQTIFGDITSSRERTSNRLSEVEDNLRAEWRRIQDAIADTTSDDPEVVATANSELTQALEAYQEYWKQRVLITQQGAEDEKEAQREAFAKTADLIVSTISSLSSTTQEMYSSWYEGREQQLKRQGKSEEEATEILKREGKRRFEAQKAILYAEAMANAISAGIAVYHSTLKSGIPAPYNTILAAAQYAAVTGSLFARARQIKNMQIGGNASGGGSVSSGSGATGSYESLNSAVVRERAISFENTRQSGNELAQIAENTAETAQKIRDMKVTYDDRISAVITDKAAAHKNMVYR